MKTQVKLFSSQCKSRTVGNSKDVSECVPTNFGTTRGGGKICGMGEQSEEAR